MNRFTIFCTETQTRKALELGAPIRFASINDIRLGRYIEVESDNKVYVIPTTEQMIGWLRSKNIHIVIHKDVVDKWSAYGHNIEPIEFTIFDRLIGFNSYEEATLAAIDAVLEYLVGNDLIK